MNYDYLVVGAGLFGAVFANEMRKLGKKCLVIDRRDHIAGNIYTEKIRGIQVHRYGAHIFHTSDRRIWRYVNDLAEFNNYINSPVAVYRDELYNLPFNMNTFAKMWNVRTPKEAAERIQAQIAELDIREPANLEEQALSLVGTDIYMKLVKGYTEKQWGRDCRELPAFIIRRLPVRFTFDNNYFNDPYQGIPKGGYTGMVAKLLDGIEVRLGTAFEDFVRKDETSDVYVTRDGQRSFGKVLYTGMIDAFFGYCEGALEYRSLEFQTELLEGRRIIREMRWSTIRRGRSRSRASSNTSILSLATSRTRSSQGSIPESGSAVTSRIIRSMMSATPHCTRNICNWRPCRKMCFLEAGSGSINIMTWTK